MLWNSFNFYYPTPTENSLNIQPFLPPVKHSAMLTNLHAHISGAHFRSTAVTRSPDQQSWDVFTAQRKNVLSLAEKLLLLLFLSFLMSPSHLLSHPLISFLVGYSQPNRFVFFALLLRQAERERERQRKRERNGREGDREMCTQNSTFTKNESCKTWVTFSIQTGMAAY